MSARGRRAKLIELAKERIRAAAEVARALPFPFMLTARADQYLWGRPDLAEVIRRAQAFETAGANAIMVPGLTDPVGLKTLCGAVSLPVVVPSAQGPARQIAGRWLRPGPSASASAAPWYG